MNNEIANGVLVRLPRDMQPKNIISCFAVGKKDGKSGEIVLNAQSCRIVVDCSKSVNEFTSFKASRKTRMPGMTQLTMSSSTDKLKAMRKRGLLSLATVGDKQTGKSCLNMAHMCVQCTPFTSRTTLYVPIKSSPCLDNISVATPNTFF